MSPEQARILALRHLSDAAVAAAADASPFIWRDEAGNLRPEPDRRLLQGALLVEASTLESMAAEAAEAEAHARPTLPSRHESSDTLPAEPPCFSFDLDGEELDEPEVGRPALSPPPPRPPLESGAVELAGRVEPWLARRGGGL